MSEPKGMLLIDGHSLLFRAHYAFFKNPMKNSRGMDTSAVFGFMNMVLPLLETENPRYAVVAFDESGVTFRNEIYPEYKANRSECPHEIIEQTPYARDLIRALGIQVVGDPNYEADDLLGTLATRYASAENPVTIVTGDRDYLQLVDPTIRVMLTKKGIKETALYATEADVIEALGVPPALVADLKGLQGDSSDNIPGVPGVGPKTGVKLLTEHGSLEAALDAAPDMKKSKLKERLIEHREQALMSRELGRIVTDVAMEADLESCERGEYDREELRRLTKELELTRIAKLIESEDRGESEETRYQLVRTEAELDACLELLAHAPYVGVDTETTSQFATRAKLVGVSLSAGGRRAWYVPLAHTDETPQLAWEVVREKLRPVIGEGSSTRVVAQNAQYDMLVLARHGLPLAALGFDTMVAAYVLNPTGRRYDLKSLALDELGWSMKTFQETLGKKATFDEVPTEEALNYAAADAEAAFELYQVFGRRLDEEGLAELYDSLELPLVPVLARMQEKGILVDPDKLAEMGAVFQEEMDQLVSRCHALAGEEFNLNSPSQLSKILFESMGYEPVKKTKTGYSTDADVLRQLEAYQGCELAGLVHRHRHLAKLKGTYLDTLPTQIHPETGRIHASFNQTVAATGRISSSDPNLQNIPTRTPEGKRIREAFHPAPGHVFVAADYSQIELRILAHLSGSRVLCEAFERGEDVHTRTAAEVFEVEEAAVTPEMRDKAKAINFGLIYGQSAHGLAQSLLITRGEAKEFIERYFARLPEVEAFLEAQKEEARETGAVTTMLGRRRAIPDIHAKQPGTRAFAERVAVNTPIQGSAADLIKKAMLEVEARLRGRGDSARMVLQIHDELILEVPEDAVEEVSALLAEVMEGALEMKVPVKVQVSTGSTWAALK